MTKEVDYIFLIPGNTFNNQFLQCWTQTLNFLNVSGVKAMAKFAYSPYITEVRNVLLSDISQNQTDKTKVFGGNIKFKKVIFIDSDIFWTIDDINKLLSSDKDIICGVYVTTDRQRVSISEDNKVFLSVGDFKSRPKDSLIEISSAGLGFTACSYDALNSLSYPFFDLINLPEIVQNIAVMGEDVLFFNKLRENGFKAYADPSLIVGHMKSTILIP